MAIRDGILPEFDQEMASTRKTLERVPEGKPEYKPHEKSMALDRLAGHVAELPGFAAAIIGQDSIDARPQDPSKRRVPLKMSSRQQLLEEFDKNVAAGRAAIAGASDEHLLKTWSLTAGDKTIFSLPRIAALRGFMMNHLIHHRAQLGVYLRLNDLPVPSIYGPSADEEVFGDAKSEAAQTA
ncbi:MAG TPA: DinB family protein [Candidatus Acidoferrales bacterium]|nr:DinB family protein [Candidatus Acidoferrales bacterium]